MPEITDGDEHAGLTLNVNFKSLAMKLRFLAISLLFFQGAVVSHAQKPVLMAGDSIDRYIMQALADWKIPGAAVCIVKNDSILLQKGYGVRNLNTMEKVDDQTIFPLASITKTFTGTLLATLEAEGKVSLNDLVRKWIPGFTMKDKLYEQQITLADILSHRSGWKTFQGDFINTESSLDFPSMIQKFSMLTPAYPIRTRFGYSNFGYMMAGECVKTITGQSWNSYIRERLLFPLGMNRTYVTGEAIINETNRAAGHTPVNGVITVLQADKIEPYSHGGIYASVSDMGTWMRALLNEGKQGSNTVIPGTAINKMWQSHTIIGKARAADRQMYLKTYGLGWEIMQYQNVEVMQHNGAYSGMLTSIALVPGLDLGVVILTNQDDHLLHETLKWQVIDAFLGKTAPDYTSGIIERQKRRKAEELNQPLKSEKAESPAVPFATDMDEITGTYICDYYGHAWIRKVNDTYVLTLEHHPNLEGLLTPAGLTVITCTYNHPMFGKMQFPFVIKDKKVKSFTLYTDSFIESDGYEFRKISSRTKPD